MPHFNACSMKILQKEIKLCQKVIIKSQWQFMFGTFFFASDSSTFLRRSKNLKQSSTWFDVYLKNVKSSGRLFHCGLFRMSELYHKIRCKSFLNNSKSKKIFEKIFEKFFDSLKHFLKNPSKFQLTCHWFVFSHYDGNVWNGFFASEVNAKSDVKISLKISKVNNSLKNS